MLNVSVRSGGWFNKLLNAVAPWLHTQSCLLLHTGLMCCYRRCLVATAQMRMPRRASRQSTLA